MSVGRASTEELARFAFTERVGPLYLTEEAACDRSC
jgi:hypothetical protein